MLKILHRLINITGKYKGRIRASYVTAFLKGIMMKAPLILCFFCISWFMQGEMDVAKCIYLGIAVLASVILQKYRKDQFRSCHGHGFHRRELHGSIV